MPDSNQNDAGCRRKPVVESRSRYKIFRVEGDHADAAHDAIERKRLEQALEESEQRYRRLVELSREAILVHSEGTLVFVSEKAAMLLGASTPEQLLGKPFLDFVQPKDRDALSQHIGTLAGPGRSAPFLRRKLIRIDGTTLHAEVAANACGYRGKPAVQLLVESRLSHLAQYDVLTELPNRSQFRDRLGGAMARGSRNKQWVGVMLLGLDRFRTVNATLGQEAGDLALRQVAERLRRSVRKSDTVARLGGDEFAVILEGLAGREGAAILAFRILEALSLPLEINGKRVRVTASIGIAAFPLDGDDIDALLRNAEVAMHCAKRHGRNTYRLYTPELDTQSRRDALGRAGIEQRLASLTPREREVLDMLVSGKANKMIAYLLGASPRTIEQHRARVMGKMQADSLPGLVRMVLDLRG
ncbi:MAG: diguanylate cyclase [Thiobacillus sp.]|jgi:diguanylate cyclase (GGDEF)-like protein/PAS domain S-box-containing protein